MTATDADLSRALDVAGTVVHDEVVRARAPWSHVVRAGQTLRIVDLEGNQAVDCLALRRRRPDRALQRAGHHRRRRATCSSSPAPCCAPPRVARS